MQLAATMTFVEHEIMGGDHAAAGRASQVVKERLQKQGVDSLTMRRALIAVYEAAANVAGHARRGWLRASIDATQLEVEVEDEGPGIADVDRALREGYSTAPVAAPDPGCGTGMGLPTIRRSADLFSIRSTRGRGTLVTFAIRYRAQDGLDAPGSSIRIDSALCDSCGACLEACETGALCLRSDGPEIGEHLCVDCGCCIDACPTGALSVRPVREASRPRKELTRVVPSVFLLQFEPGFDPVDVLQALGSLGYGGVYALNPWEDALRHATMSCANGGAVERPVIHPACPAVLSLVATRFPSLLGSIAPFRTPLEAARDEIRGGPLALVPLCPSERALLSGPAGSARVEIVELASLLSETSLALGHRRRRDSSPPVDDRSASPWNGHTGVLRAAGMRRVVQVLEHAEKGLLGDVQILDLMACDRGCHGGLFLHEERGATCRRPARDLAPQREADGDVEGERPTSKASDAPRGGQGHERRPRQEIRSHDRPSPGPSRPVTTPRPVPSRSYRRRKEVC